MGTAGLVLLIIGVSALGGGVMMTVMTGNLDWLTDLNPFAADVTPDVDIDIEGIELSRFTGVLCKEDNVATKVTEEPVYIWHDWNQDGVMQRSPFLGIVDGELLGGEIEQDSSTATYGVFTSPSEYPIGRVIWLFIDDEGEDYQMTYHKFAMTGTAHTDGTAKSIGNVFCRATDDAATYAGLVRGIAIDDGTDYNYTLNGASGEFEIRVTWATSDAGINSQTSPDFYSGSGPWTHWGSGKEYAPDFIGGYCSNQDATDLGLDNGDFDFFYQGASNTYFAKFLDDYDDDPNLFYDSDLDSAPTFKFTFDVDISAVGELTYVGIFQGVEWSDFGRGNWNPTTDANIIGTLGADWDWVA